MKQTAGPQQVIERLATRSVNANWSPANCRLAKEAVRRRGGGCSVCKVTPEFELDQTVAELINKSVFKRAGACPYHVISSHLAAGLVFGPETIRARTAGRYPVDPVVELKGALRRIGMVLKAASVSRDDIEALSDQGDRWKAFYDVLLAERALQAASAVFRSQVPAPTGRSQRGRVGKLHVQAVARTMARAWRVLTGRLPAKDNLNFQSLLSAAFATVFGHPAKDPNWEFATRIAVMRLKRDDLSRS